MYSEKRLPEFPDVPTLIESGYNVVAPSVYSIVGPAGMPKDRIKKLHDVFHESMQEPGYQALLKKLELQPDYRNSQDLKKLIESIYESSGRALREAESK